MFPVGGDALARKALVWRGRFGRVREGVREISHCSRPGFPTPPPGRGRSGRATLGRATLGRATLGRATLGRATLEVGGGDGGVWTHFAPCTPAATAFD
jgi:hypothetical protein